MGGKCGRTLNINERKAFIAAIDMKLPMKAIKRNFGMTKEEVEGNIRLLPYHRLYLSSMEEIANIRKGANLTIPLKMRAIEKIRIKVKKEWERLNGKV